MGAAEEQHDRPGLVGYGRFKGVLARESLGRPYASACLHGNLFPPSFKLREKRGEDAEVIKRYHAPEPPVMRALTHTAVPDANKSWLRAMLAGADPVLLLVGICRAQTKLGKRVDGAAWRQVVWKHRPYSIWRCSRQA